MANNQQGFPQLSAPIADSGTFRVTQPWQQFFISIWNRTGAQQGATTSEPGDLKAIAYNTPPAGWLLCNGQSVGISQFTALFSAIGTTWGAGDGVTTFNLPNLEGGLPIGASTLIPFGSTGGTTTTTLTLANLPAHSHSINDPGHFHASVVNASANTSGSSSGSVTAGNTSTALTGITQTNNTGSGTSFSNLPPYASCNWVIKT